MLNAIAVNLPGLEALQAAFAQAPAICIEELAKAMTEADTLLEREVKDATPTAQGTLRASIGHTEEVSESGVIGMVTSPLNYAEPVELGTRPHFPPIEALIDWVVLKLGVPEKDARSVAFLVARKISRVGTPAWGMFNRTFAWQQSQVEGYFEQALDRITARLAGNA